jgi:hypothetical protein
LLAVVVGVSMVAVAVVPVDTVVAYQEKILVAAHQRSLH